MADKTYGELMKEMEGADTEVATLDPLAPAEEIVQPQNVTEGAQAAPVVEDNVADFDMPGEEPVNGERLPVNGEQQPADWRQALKAADKKEVMKELGLPELDEFDIEFAKYRKNGGDPYKYLEAKAKDWTKVSDTDVMKGEIAKKYPNLTPEQQAFMFNKKYGINELDEEDARQEKQIALQADAFEIKQKNIAEQQSFKIPEHPQPEQAQIDVQEAIKQQVAQQAQQAAQFVRTHEVTKNLLNTKRVSYDAGDGVNFHFNVSKPASLVDIVKNGFGKYTTKENGEPDLDALYQIGLFAMNRQKVMKDLINYGKTLQLKAQIDEGQNAGKPDGRPPVNVQVDEKEAWRNAREVSFGQLMAGN